MLQGCKDTICFRELASKKFNINFWRICAPKMFTLLVKEKKKKKEHCYPLLPHEPSIIL